VVLSGVDGRQAGNQRRGGGEGGEERTEDGEGIRLDKCCFHPSFI